MTMGINQQRKFHLIRENLWVILGKQQSNTRLIIVFAEANAHLRREIE